jgi:large conductance mechanosensitive channel
MGFIKEFRDFAVKGNVVDLAVAVIIGAAFSAIIGSLVEDVITPLLLDPALKAANLQSIDQLTWGAVKYGKFLAAIIKFIMVAIVLFLVIKGIQKTKKKEEVVAAGPSSTDLLLMEIRDQLKK